MTSVTRRGLLQSSAQIGLLGVVGHGTRAVARENKKPNIVYILADDLGVYDLGCYGQTKISTPHIDALARQGMIFTSAYGGGPICSPSRCALMTGRHTGHATIRDNFALAGGIVGFKGKEKIRRLGLYAGEATVATVLRDGGYKTGLIGKWHLDGYDPNAIPTKHGFDDFQGWLTQTETTQGYFPLQWYDGVSLTDIPENQQGRHDRYETDLCTDRACDFIRRNRNDPFFLTVAYNAPHSPHVAPTEGSYAGLDWGAEEKSYAAMIEFLDAGVGAIINTLKEQNLLENTVVFVSSDHGPRSEPTPEQTQTARFFRSHGSLRGYKRDLYEGGIRVPLIVSWPGTITAGTISDSPVYHPDFLPTAAALAGAKIASTIQVDGKDLTSVLLHSKPLENRPLYWETYEPSFWQAARWGEWKAVRPPGSTAITLFNLASDPSETQDLAAQKPDITRRFQSLFAKAHSVSPNYL